MTPDNPRDAALTYAARFGWRVLPTDRTSKAPLLTHGVHDASTDPGVISGWFDRFPGANVAVATGAPGPQVLDVDHPELAPALIAGLRAGAEAITGRTDSIGRHLYFAGDDHRTRGWPWGELRGVGSYVVAPPSLHQSGQPYGWEREPTGILEPVPRAVLALVEEVEREPFARRVGVPHGERHGYLQRYAEQLAIQGYREEEAIAAEIEAEFQRACVVEPAPRPDEFSSLARWVVGTELMGRLRRRDGGVLALTRALAKGRGLPSHEELVGIVEGYGGWRGKLDLAEVKRRGPGPRDALEIRFTNGGVAYFERQDSVTTRGHWARIITGATGGLAEPSTTGKAEDLIRLYRALCLLAGPVTARTEAEDLADELGVLLSLTEPVAGHNLDSPGARYDLIIALRARPIWDPANTAKETHPALILIGEDSYLRGGDLLTWYRHRGAQIGSAAFPGRMEMAGLERVEINSRGPRPTGGGRRPTPSTVLYRLSRDEGAGGGFEGDE